MTIYKMAKWPNGTKLSQTMQMQTWKVAPEQKQAEAILQKLM